MPAHHPGEVHRFSQPWEAEASLALRAGDPRAAEAYAEAGRLRSAHPPVLADQIARHHQRLVEHGRTVAITTASAGTARAINCEIQYRRYPARRGPSVALADGTVVFAGDRIATRRNDPTLLTDRRAEVRNRHTWDVRARPPQRRAHRHRSRAGKRAASRRVRGPPRRARLGHHRLRQPRHHRRCRHRRHRTLRHPSRDLRRHDRGRRTNLAWIPDPTGRRDPAEALAQAIARPPNAATAHATRDRLYQQAGLSPPQPTPAPPAALPDPVQRMLARLDALETRPSTGRSLGS